MDVRAWSEDQFQTAAVSSSYMHLQHHSNKAIGLLKFYKALLKIRLWSISPTLFDYKFPN